jgi:putative acetyltransferase
MVLRPATPADVEDLFDVWHRAVLATHDFVAPEDLGEFATIVRERYLPHAALVVVAEPDGRPYAFMGLTGANIDSLFVAPERHRRGAGRALVEYARQQCPGGLTVDVNEANGPAVEFYARMGFRRVGRSPTDAAGKPYPILHMRWR